MPISTPAALSWAAFRRVQSFAAIDFETANPKRASACAVGIVRVDHGKITGRLYHRIRPPAGFARVTLDWIHGLTWEDLKDAPTFRQLWPTIDNFLDGVQALAAHNVAFDRSVMLKATSAARIQPPSLPWFDTIQLARQRWNIKPTGLANVCRRLEIPLNHHDAASDAEAVAEIILKAHGR